MRLAVVPANPDGMAGGKPATTAPCEEAKNTVADSPIPPPDNRPTIVYSQRLVETVDLAEAALEANPDLALYTRGDQLVRVVQDQALLAPALDRPVRGSRVVAVTAHQLRECLDRSAHWFREGRGGTPIPALPPMWATETLLARSKWNFPALEGISSTPVLRANGTIQGVPGYDVETRVLFDPGSTRFPPMADRPSVDDAIVAWEVLRAPFVDFTFVSESDFSALLATLLAILARNLIVGPCPMTAIRSPMPGAGKGLAADAISVIVLGRPCARTARPTDDDEMRKHILSIGIGAQPLVLLDNVSGTFGSHSIAAALTSTAFSDRLLGVSKILTVPMLAVWMLTGNNVSFRRDLGRRVLLCDLDPRCEHPEDRSGFRFPNLLKYLFGERPRLVVAGLTILRAYLLAGQPAHGKSRKGSFEAWDDVIRGALIWLGAPDPLEGQVRLRETSDAELEALRCLLLQWWGRYGGTGKTLASVLKETAEDEEFRAALAEIACTDPAHLTSNRLGYAFRRAVGRIASGLRLEKDQGNTGGVVRWRVVPEEVTSGDGGDSGDESHPEDL